MSGRGLGLAGAVASSAMSNVDKKHLTIADICAELGVARSTFYDWRAKGAGPRCIKLPNGELRIRRADLETWMVALEDTVA